MARDMRDHLSVTFDFALICLEEMSCFFVFVFSYSFYLIVGQNKLKQLFYGQVPFLVILLSDGFCPIYIKRGHSKSTSVE